MTNKKKKGGLPPNQSKVAIEDLAFELGLIEADVRLWLMSDNPEVWRDHRGRLSVDAKFRDAYSNHPDYLNALRRSLNSERNHHNKSLPQAESNLQEISSTIERYERIILELKKFHEKYLEVANSHGSESAVIAAYLLFGRAINLLNMGCLCLKNGYFYGGAVMRDIDETLDLAKYFIVTEHTEQGKRDLLRWFRLNIAPRHEKCRQSLSEDSAMILPEVPPSEYKALLNELYQKKSKWTHPTFRVIREITSYSTEGDIRIEHIDYGPTLFNHRLRELSVFYRSSIWTAFQSVMRCFKETMPLERDDVEYILECVHLFAHWEETGMIPEKWR